LPGKNIASQYREKLLFRNIVRRSACLVLHRRRNSMTSTRHR
jgi:hypothetical protein